MDGAIRNESETVGREEVRSAHIKMKCGKVVDLDGIDAVSYERRGGHGGVVKKNVAKVPDHVMEGGGHAPLYKGKGE